MAPKAVAGIWVLGVTTFSNHHSKTKFSLSKLTIQTNEMPLDRKGKVSGSDWGIYHLFMTNTLTMTCSNQEMGLPGNRY